MLIYQENTYIIKNWYKYQSIDKYEKILEQNRARQKRFRDKKKEESNVTQTSSNVEEENITEENKIENNRIEEKNRIFELYNGIKEQTIDLNNIDREDLLKTLKDRIEELIPKYITTEDMIASVNYLLNI